MLEFFPFPFLTSLAIVIVLLAILWRRKYSRYYLFFFSLFWLYLLLVVGATLFPIPLPQSAREALSRQSAVYILSRVNLIPFSWNQFNRLNPAYIFRREIIANILLTVPFGFGISFIARIRARHIAWLAPALGLGIETSQLVLCLVLGVYYRGVDINDVLMNTLGVLCGYALFWIFSWLYVAVTARLKIEHKGLFAYVHSVASQVQPAERNLPPR
jgi:glycopeptide antibiotics resistance protein